MGAGRIEVKDLKKVFSQEDGTELLVLEKLNFCVEGGTFTSIIGLSGCGKSTILNIIAEIEQPTSGEVRCYAADGSEAKMGYVFQTPRLLPWLNALDNIRLVHEDKSPDEANELAKKCIRLVGLSEDTANKFPHQLSGGMQQRIGIARAISIEPDILLMDEPFSHLDAITADILRTELLRIWRETRVTILFVTHDLSEAIFLSDRILMLTRNPAHVCKDLLVEVPRPRKIDEPSFLTFMAKATKEFHSIGTGVEPSIIKPEKRKHLLLLRG